MIEVEIRAELSKEQFEKLLAFMRAHGTHTKSQDREMILLRNYPGYSEDPTKREADIRIKNTNGKCEIVLKRKASAGNRGRSEIIVGLTDDSLDNIKEVMKQFGCTSGLWMHRKTEAFEYHGIEWAVIEAPRDKDFSLYQYEAELALGDGEDAKAAHEKLLAEARALGLPVLETDEEMRTFISKLDKEVNREIIL